MNKNQTPTVDAAKVVAAAARLCPALTPTTGNPWLAHGLFPSTEAPKRTRKFKTEMDYQWNKAMRRGHIMGVRV